MPKRRRIVPDASVMLAAYFPEDLDSQGRRIDLTRLALPVLKAIRARSVVALAPTLLLHEFVKGAWRKASSRTGEPTIDISLVTDRVLDFLALPIVYHQANATVASIVLDYVTHAHISPPDA